MFRGALERDAAWEAEFVAKNRKVMSQIIRLATSLHGVVVMLVYLNGIVMVIQSRGMRGFLPAFLYLSSLFVYAVLIANMPVFMFRLLFPEREIGERIMMRFAGIARIVTLMIRDTYRGMFVRWDAVTITGFASFVLCWIIFVRSSIPLYWFMHGFAVGVVVVVGVVASWITAVK